MHGKPVIFRKSVQVRFSDIDRYQHVNTVKYPDYVFSSRIDFIRERFGYAPDYFDKLGVGFYTTKSEMTYRRGIPSTAFEVMVESYASSFEGNRIKVEFKITDVASETLYCEGAFQFMVVDLRTARPVTEVPSEIAKVLFE